VIEEGFLGNSPFFGFGCAEALANECHLSAGQTQLVDPGLGCDQVVMLADVSSGSSRLSSPAASRIIGQPHLSLHLMIPNTISRIIVRVSRWSSTSNTAARPERRPASHVTLQVSPKHSVSAALSNPITRSGVRNHKVVAHRRLLPARRATIKSQ
jgi:hypothetical protein